MSFNKRYIKQENLESASKKGLDYLIDYVRKPDFLIIESNGISKQVCDIIGETKDKSEMKEKLKSIGFYEFE